jgi:hypothetical protein
MRASQTQPPLRVTFVYEYIRRNDDWMMDSLIKSLGARLPRLRAKYLHGLFPTYRPGGLHPERLFNLAWVYLRVAIHLLVSRPDAVLVRTTPPGVQHWTAFWARFRKVPVLCWLMDYHPEMEARQLQKRGYNQTARLLRKIDAAVMPRFTAVVTLDQAMAKLAAARAPQVPVITHPTWTTTDAASLNRVAYAPGAGEGPLRLAYSGNLGKAHDLSTLREILARLVTRRPVKLHVVGASPGGEQRFRELTEPLEISLETHPRVPFTKLRELYHLWRIDAGIVLLADDSAGLVSPSKFSGYINFGVPLLYVGPPDTNTAEVCTRFGGGFWLPNRASDNALAEVADALLSAGDMTRAAHGAMRAATHFASFNSESLADLLTPYFKNTDASRARDVSSEIAAPRAASSHAR